MAEYIEREEVFRIWKDMAASASVASLVTAIRMAQAADIAPVVHGYNTGRCCIFHCSECGYGVSDIFQEDELNYPVGEFNYCPNCGARMDGEMQDNG